jgi:tetratricopeptide (TPR) repeat protein
LAVSQSVAAQTGRRAGRSTGRDRPRTGDPTDPAKKEEALRRKASKYLDAGHKLLAKGRIQPAKTKFKAVIELVGLEGAGQSAFNELMRLHTDGMTRVDQAAAHYENGLYRKALELAGQTKVLYANLLGGIPGTGHMPNVSHAAVKLIGRIESDPKAREALQEYEAARRLKRVESLERKAKKDPAKHYDIYKLLETVAKRFPDCPTGRECINRLEDIKADKKLYKLIRREEARRFIAAALQRAEQYERHGLHDQAAAEYKKLAKKYPGKSLKELRRMAAKRDP